MSGMVSSLPFNLSLTSYLRLYALSFLFLFLSLLCVSCSDSSSSVPALSCGELGQNCCEAQSFCTEGVCAEGICVSVEHVAGIDISQVDKDLTDAENQLTEIYNQYNQNVTSS